MVRSPARRKYFSLLHNNQTRYRAQPGSQLVLPRGGGRGGQRVEDVRLTTHLYLVSSLKMIRAITSLPQITSSWGLVTRACAIINYAILSVPNVNSLNKPKTKIKLVNLGKVTHKEKTFVLVENWTMNSNILGN